MQVVVEAVRVDLHGLRGVRREALRQRVLERLARNTEDAAPVTATRTPPAVCATNTPTSAKRDAGFGNFTYAAFFGIGKLTDVMISPSAERGLVHPLEEIVGGDLALVGVTIVA